jgi:hypothetical protein
MSNYCNLYIVSPRSFYKRRGDVRVRVYMEQGSDYHTLSVPMWPVWKPHIHPSLFLSPSSLLVISLQCRFLTIGVSGILWEGPPFKNTANNTVLYCINGLDVLVSCLWVSPLLPSRLIECLLCMIIAWSHRGIITHTKYILYIVKYLEFQGPVSLTADGYKPKQRYTQAICCLIQAV